MTALQLPVFDVPTWFLMCLVMVECIHYVVFRFLRDSDARIAVAIVVFYLAGYAIKGGSVLPARATTRCRTGGSAYEAIADAARPLSRRRADTAARLAGGRVSPRFGCAWRSRPARSCLFTYNLNQGPFRMKIEAVVILAAAHGSILWFPLTALAGTLAVLALGKVLESADWMAYLGRNALILFCLNGVVYHHVNGPFAAWFTGGMPQDGWVGGRRGAALLSLLSIALAVPLVATLNRCLPQLVGRPTVSGPLLPRLL